MSQDSVKLKMIDKPEITRQLNSGLSPEDEERIIARYGVDDDIVQVMKAIEAGVPVKNLDARVSESFWLREVLKLLTTKAPSAKIKALELLAKYLGIGKTGKGKDKKVVFAQDNDGHKKLKPKET